ncbi:hypothetical protein SB5_23200 [Pseudomonas oryzihabitans]|nr:hypothetical protein SB5_23200 [Pseudomonas psychrotolerans]
MERTFSSSLYQAEPSTRVPFVLRVLSTLSTWQRRIASRNELARLDTRMLADAGITEAQRYQEMHKPFWR